MFDEKLGEIKEKVRNFERQKSQLKNTISTKDFYDMLHHYEDIIEELSKIGDYATLFFFSDTSNAEARALVARINDFRAKTLNKVLFFELWWKKGIDRNNANRLLKEAGDLKNYLTYLRKLAKYTLTEPEEKIINIKDTTGINFIRKLYDQYTERFVFYITLNGKKKKLIKPELTALFQSPDAEKRKRAYRSLFQVYGRNEDILGELYRSIVLDWKNEGIHLRGYKSPISIRNILNDVSDEVVETLLSVCRNNRHVFQRYFTYKAKLLGMKQMTRYHIYAPLDAMSDKNIPFTNAVKLVFNSLKEFSPKISDLAQKVLDENHLDSEIRKGKKSGAFCATASPRITPYVLINYTSKQEDAFTLAHELGHAVHSQLAADKSILVQQATLPLAELASVFSEMIVLERTLESASENIKKSLMVWQLDSMYATIMRQAYFTLFEKKAHDSISNGAIVNKISNTYYKDLKEQFGSAVAVPEEYKYEWTYIPHFYDTPFYTYAYSFGNLLTLSLYQRYQKEKRDFVDKYIKILSSGGSKNPEKLLAEKGINIKSQVFWQNGFDYIKEKVIELERLGFN